MSKDQSAHTQIARYRIRMPAQYMRLLEPTRDPVRIRGTPYQRYTWRGVPGRLCDVIVADSLVTHRREAPEAGVVLDVTEHRPHNLPPALAETVAAESDPASDTLTDFGRSIVMEIGEKIGRFDHAKRRRYAIRLFTDQRQLAKISEADIRIVTDAVNVAEHDGELTIIIRPHDGSPPIVDTFRRLKASLQGYQMDRIVLWHFHRYYKHLPYDDAAAAAKTWAEEVAATGEAASWTLAEANRSASRYLYRLSRDLGWRKLTADDKVRLGLPDDSPQWRHVDQLLPLYAALGHATGESEATLRAASAAGDFDPDG